ARGGEVRRAHIRRSDTRSWNPERLVGPQSLKIWRQTDVAQTPVGETVNFGAPIGADMPGGDSTSHTAPQAKRESIPRVHGSLQNPSLSLCIDHRCRAACDRQHEMAAVRPHL